MDGYISESSGFVPAARDVPAAISILIAGAVAAFDADRNTSRRYLTRASALLRARHLARTAGVDAHEAGRQGGLAAWQVNRVIDYVETHLAEKITGLELAKVARLSIGHLFRAFKISVGTPPFHYIALRRFELACTMLKNTREPLSQVAIAVGLCDQSHLCRVFRRLTGVSPAVWRRAHENEPGFPSANPAFGRVSKGPEHGSRSPILSPSNAHAAAWESKAGAAFPRNRPPSCANLQPSGPLRSADARAISEQLGPATR